MHDFDVMKCLKANVQRLGVFLEESFFVGDYIGVIDRCEYSDLVEGIVFLFVVEFAELNLHDKLLKTQEKERIRAYLLKGIFVVVGLSLDAKHLRKGTGAYKVF